MAATDHVRTLGPRPAGPPRAALAVSLRPALAAGALCVLSAAGLAVAVRAGGAPSFLIPFSQVPVPYSLGGPVAGLAPRLTPAGFSGLVLAMCAAYALVLVCASAVRARWAITAVVALHVAFALAPPLLSGDLYGYLIFARLGELHGLNPYVHGGGAAPFDLMFPYVKWPSMRSPYGPVFTLATYPLAPLGIAAGVWITKAVAAAASLGVVALVGACARRLGREPVRAMLFVGLNPVLLVYGVGGAHNDLIMLLVSMGAVHLVLAGREGPGAAGMVGAVGIKATAGLVLPFLLAGARRRLRATAGALAGAVGLGAVAVAGFGPDPVPLLSGLAAQSELASSHSVPHYLGRLVGLEGATGVTPGMRLTASAVLGLAVAGLLVWTWRGADWIAAAGWATFVLLLTAAFLMPWYVVWLLPLAALARGPALPLAALGFTAFVVATRLPLLFG